MIDFNWRGGVAQRRTDGIGNGNVNVYGSGGWERRTDGVGSGNVNVYGSGARQSSVRGVAWCVAAWMPRASSGMMPRLT
jgi:hypothetical protein